MIKRRQFIAGLGSAAAWPVVARAQQAAMPVIGFLSSNTESTNRRLVAAFHRGLIEQGYVEGRNVETLYQWAKGENDQLLAMADDLVRRQVSVIVAAGGPAALAAKTATATVPIVFGTGDDPVQAGLVASLGRPGRNLTGVTNLGGELGPKQLELLHELVPAASVFTFLVNPTNPVDAGTFSKTLQEAARTLGLELHVLNAGTESEFDTVFASLAQLRAGGLVISPDGFLISHREQLAALALRHKVPAIQPTREFAAAGGLMSYGSSLTDSYRLMGVYVGRILKGEKPAHLPVLQPTRFELVVNLKTAKALGLTISDSFLDLADEVIE